jgi:hypothetical protein
MARISESWANTAGASSAAAAQTNMGQRVMPPIILD